MFENLTLNDLPPVEEMARAMGHFHERNVVAKEEFFEAINKPLPDPTPALEHAVTFLGGELFWPCCWRGVINGIQILIHPDPTISRPHQIKAELSRMSFKVTNITDVEHIPILIEASKIVQNQISFDGVMEGDVVHGSARLESTTFTFSVPVDDLCSWLSLMVQ